MINLTPQLQKSIFFCKTSYIIDSPKSFFSQYLPFFLKKKKKKLNKKIYKKKKKGNY